MVFLSFMSDFLLNFYRILLKNPLLQERTVNFFLLYHKIGRETISLPKIIVAIAFAFSSFMIDKFMFSEGGFSRKSLLKRKNGQLFSLHKRKKVAKKKCASKLLDRLLTRPPDKVRRLVSALPHGRHAEGLFLTRRKLRRKGGAPTEPDAPP